MATLRVRPSRPIKPGLHFATPFVERIAYRRSLKETMLGIRPQTAITKDNVHVQLDGAVYVRVEDSYKASYGIDNPGRAQSVKISHIDTVISHIDTVISHIDTVILWSSSISILSSS